MDKPLDQFIAHAREKGMDHSTIRMLLLSAGWKEKDVAQALSAQSLEMPVPVPPEGGSRDAFFHLLTFACLYTTIISVIVLFFTYLNIHFPDPAVDRYADPTAAFSTIRWFTAAVIVAFPLFLWFSRLLLVEMRRHPEKAWSAVRRWLTYLTLFVTALAMIGDVITLVFNLLEGELSVRFLLKVLIVIVLTGLTFTYYFLSLRSTPIRRS